MCVKKGRLIESTSACVGFVYEGNQTVAARKEEEEASVYDYSCGDMVGGKKLVVHLFHPFHPFFSLFSSGCHSEAGGEGGGDRKKTLNLIRTCLVSQKNCVKRQGSGEHNQLCLFIVFFLHIQVRGKPVRPLGGEEGSEESL